MKNVFYLLIVFTIFSCGGGGTSAPAPAKAGSGSLEGYSLEAYPSGGAERAYKQDDKGIKFEEGAAYNGIRQGTWLTFHTGRNAGIIKTSSSYANGVLNGPYLEFDNVGRMEKLAYYGDGVLHGRSTKYRFGKPLEEADYKNGQLDGIFRTYYNNAVLQQESNYSGGQKNGTATYYNEDGNIIMEYEYKNNEIVSGGKVDPPRAPEGEE